MDREFSSEDCTQLQEETCNFLSDCCVANLYISSIFPCLGRAEMKNYAMDEDAKKEPEQSVANRVLSTFIASVREDETLAEVAKRMESVLLDGDTINEASLRGNSTAKLKAMTRVIFVVAGLADALAHTS